MHGIISHGITLHGVARLTFATLAAALMAGCADSGRFIGDPLGNPFRSASADAGRELPSRDLPGRDSSSRDSASRDVGGDMAPPPAYRAARSGAIQSRPLAPPSEGSRHVADYATPAYENPRLASSYQPPRTERTASIAAPSGHGSWSSAGGMSVIAGTGETAAILSSRYNVPVEALLHENGLSSAGQIRPGTRLVIPVYNANGGGGSPSRVAAAELEARRPHDHSSRARLLAKHEPMHEPVREAARESTREPAARETPAAAPGRQEAKLARNEDAKRSRSAKLAPKGGQEAEPRVPHGRELAMTKAEHAKAERLAKVEQSKAEQAKAEQMKAAHSRIEQAKVEQMKAEQMKAEKLAAAKAARKPVAVAKAVPEKAAPEKAAPEQAVRVAKVEEAPRKATVDPTPTASLPPPAAAEKVSANGTPEFRWPAHGRIIQGFKSGGNDGINIAVPEGTQVKAAESGVVAYAGNEIKGFGNLVLIRHPNGYVTAYANNGDIAVRRGEQVKRGQTIAKSGQSGNVASPQLHFELRKGSTPVDPTRYLAGL